MRLRHLVSSALGFAPGVKEARTRRGSDENEYELVLLDEFEVDGRRF